MISKALIVPLALAGWLTTNLAHASFTVYSTQASFLAAISNPGVDTFNDLSPTAALSTPQSRTAGSYAYTASAGPSSNLFTAGNTASDVWLSTNNRSDTITFSGFSSTVRGIGGFFFGSDSSGLSTTLPASMTLTAVDASGTTTQSVINPTTSTFFGFVSTGPISSINLWVGSQNVGVSGVWPTVNNLTVGVSAVPEPETYALLVAGLGTVGWMAGRRRKSMTPSRPSGRA